MRGPQEKQIFSLAELFLVVALPEKALIKHVLGECKNNFDMTPLPNGFFMNTISRIVMVV